MTRTCQSAFVYFKQLTFKPIYTQTVHLHLLGRLGVSDRHAFMDNVSFDWSSLGC